MDKYYAKVTEILATVQNTQKAAMSEVSERCTKALLSDRKLFFFGSGHSHMLA
ncbi:SIS domain-containing protein [Paenibacillus nasutitermitis]|uniref:SIS domain-containing protein n=1 Tax=Paenibacillus nasutitermitis TaxID=1652958 RepID=A0A917DNQ3_9BACL|nr:SIS domain-containing protein [Paenibacillus nasutitermitis]GGD56329.1 hypothetical protein GCM10010911_12560 [Paenibacillus nasutitermitis]